MRNRCEHKRRWPGRATFKWMDNKDNPGPSDLRTLKRVKRHISRTRLVMGLLLIVAIPIFIGLANRAVHENADAIRQGLGQ
jgi:hypothetical protein